MLNAAVSILSGLGLTAPDHDHGLPGLAAGEPFGFQVAIKTAQDAQDFAFAEWIVLLPLIAAALCGLYAAFGVKNRLPGWTTVVALGASFVLAVMMVVKLDPTSGSPIVVHLFDWVDFSWGNGSKQESIRANFALYLDGLSCYWILFVTFLGTLIAFYSTEYMDEDRGTGYCRFFAGVSVFLFAMTCLVLGDNLLMLYLGWEGVGLASYLLIGYYYHKPEAAAAAKKAFVMNRIGDLGLAVGIYLTWLEFGTLEFSVLFEALQSGSTGIGAADGLAAAFIPWCFMLAAFGKSAQIPLFTWLPDAMEGPTPVSALIHAATMVTAGVYLIARTMPLFLMNKASGGHALDTVAWIGGITALVAASIGMAQYDMKRVLAYSTISQLGYMFMGLGLITAFGGAYHTLTHAFFKATLFLGAGAVMHGFAGQLDIRKLSGLMRIPGWRIVGIAMLIGGLWLAGLPLTAGYFSKDEILAQAFITPGPGFKIVGWIGIFTAGLTAYYTFRIWFRVFVGPIHYKPAEEPSDGQEFHPHAPGWRMKFVLIILSLGAIWLALGYYGFAGNIVGSEPWVHSMIEHSSAGTGLQYKPTGGESSIFGFGIDPHTMMYFVSGTVGVVGFLVAFYFHFWRRKQADSLRIWLLSRLWIGWLPRAMERKWYVDEFYNATIRLPLWIVAQASYVVDRLLVDGVLVNGTARLAKFAGEIFRPLYNGKLQGYASTMAGGIALILAWIVWVWMRGGAS
jgi:NADH-quinone oxidoreductase subunit L